MELADLALLADYMEWADRKVLHAIADLPRDLWERSLPSSHGSLAGTVEHLFAVEWTWLERVGGRSPRSVGPEGGVRDRERLAGMWPEVWDGWRRAAHERDAGEPIRYRTTEGTEHETPLGHILLHVSHHSSAYRGQVAAILRSLGRTPASTDLIFYLRGRSRA
jgi:uncharacterized damage-inducible protein DinB